MSTFWKSIISAENTNSSKRLVTLIMAAHFIVTSFLVSFFVFYLIIYTPKGSVNKDLVALLEKILESDFYVILAGLGFITAENLGNIMLEKLKTKGPVSKSSIDVETVDIDKTLE